MADGAYIATTTVTRAANQTPYTANDVVGGAGTFTLANGPQATLNMWLTSLRFTLNITAIPSGMTTFSVYFYNILPPSAIADNSPFTYGAGDRASYLGRITGLTATLLGTGTSTPTLQLENINDVFAVPGSTIFYYLVTDGAFTPAANSETYTGTAVFVAA